MPATMVDDLPFTAANGWSPNNASGEHLGSISVREALKRSSNLASVRVLQHTGTQPAREWTGRFGLDVARQPNDLTLALGTGSATPLQMAQAYATLANGGWPVASVVIEKITDAQGKVLFEAPAAPPLTEETRAIPARNAYVVGSLLNDVARAGTAARAQALLKRPDIYGKTGTTNDAVDAWFAGYQPSLAAAVWVGYDKPRSLGGGESAGASRCRSGSTTWARRSRACRWRNRPPRRKAWCAMARTGCTPNGTTAAGCRRSRTPAGCSTRPTSAARSARCSTRSVPGCAASPGPERRPLSAARRRQPSADRAPIIGSP